MSDRVARRDYLDGSNYPPARTGMRGSHPGSFDAAHALRDGQEFSLQGMSTEERFDLVVVGAGLSGLAAAWFYRQRQPDATVLILDNHDDFGGHARRNEFMVEGRLLVGYGGSEAIQSPDSLYGPAAKGLLAGIGVHIERFETAFDAELYPSLGLSRGVFFTRETFGEDKLVTGDPMRMVADDIPPGRMNERSPEAFIADFPVSAEAKAKLIELFTSDRNAIGDMSREEAIALLEKTSYRDYLKRFWGLDDQAADTFQGRSHDFFALGIDGVPAISAMATGYPGFAGLELPVSASLAAEMEERYIYHFPDGNASIARLMVRSMIAAVAPGETMDDIVTARFDYGKLDVAGSPTRLRLSSTAVRVENRDEGARVGYVRDGELRLIDARQCVLAGYHMMIPDVMPELPAPQRKALSQNVKAPLVYVNVAVRDWRPWVCLGVHEITNPMGFFSRLKVDYPVSLGDYRFPSSPDEPMLLHLVHVPTMPNQGLTAREQFRAGRELLFKMTFEEFEEQIRDELTRMLGPGGFDAGRDIAGITVNRWGHAYSYAGNTLFDKQVDGPMPYEVARERAGHVAIANADAAWTPFAHEAIAQAHRAVEELVHHG